MASKNHPRASSLVLRFVRGRRQGRHVAHYGVHGSTDLDAVFRAVFAYVAKCLKASSDVEAHAEDAGAKVINALWEKSNAEVGLFDRPDDVMRYARVIALNFVRKRKSRGDWHTETQDDADRDATTVLSAEPSPLDDVLTAELFQLVRAALERDVEPQARECFERIRMNGESEAAVAAEKGISLSTLRSQLSRAGRVVRRVIHEYGQDRTGGAS